MDRRSKQRHLFSIDDLPREEIEGILDRADEFRQMPSFPPLLAGRIVGLLFLQPSTRTRIGFHAAALRSGAGVFEVASSRFQADMLHPESIDDTVRVVSAYCDLLVIRHADAEEVRRGMEASAVPVINGGAGREHHPTQALVDLFAIRRHHGQVEGLRIGIVGNLKDSRAARSLAQALSLYDLAELRLMSPVGMALPPEIVARFPTASVIQCSRLRPEDLDVLYVAGLPKVDEEALPLAEREAFHVTPDVVRRMPADGIVLCPLPRLDEIDRSVDPEPAARYFTQSADGLFVRMGLLQTMLEHGSRCPRAEMTAAAEREQPHDGEVTHSSRSASVSPHHS